MTLSLAPGVMPVPGYSLSRLLGRGGFGEVWEAVAPGGVRVALKFVRANPREAGPEERALAIVSNIRHPHLLDIQFATRVDDCLVIAMPLCEKSLWDRLHECREQGMVGLPPDELMGYMDEMASAVDYLNEPRHEAGDGRAKVGVQHRDIKPHNIFLVGGSTRLADFGVAKILEGRSGEHTGNMSPHYVPPEVLDGRMCRQTDQYSLAMTYYHLRTGRLPFRGESISQIIYAHLHQLADLSGLPEPERPVIARALAKEPDDRWPNCRAFVRALQAAGAAGPLSMTVPPSRIEPAPAPRPVLSSPQPSPSPSPDSTTQSLYEAQGATLRADTDSPAPQSHSRRNWLIGSGAAATLAGCFALAWFVLGPRPHHEKVPEASVTSPIAVVRTPPAVKDGSVESPTFPSTVVADAGSDLPPAPSSREDPLLSSAPAPAPTPAAPSPAPARETPEPVSLAAPRPPQPAEEQVAPAQAPDKPFERPLKGEQDIVVAIRDYLRLVPESDRGFQRFFITQNLHNNPTVSNDDLGRARGALGELIQRLSGKPAVATPKPIDRDQTVFAFDLRDVGWDERDRWNDLLSHYPYGLKHDKGQDPMTREAASEVYRLAQTSLPYVRADWFVANVSRPPLSSTLFHKNPEAVRGSSDPDHPREDSAPPEPTHAFPEPVGAVARGYSQDLGPAEVAAELGMRDPNELMILIRGNKRLRQIGLAPLLSGTSIKRADWDSLENRALSRFQEAAHELGLGTPILAY